MARMRALATEKTDAHRRQFLGQELDAITMHTPEALGQLGRTAALTENFLPVEVEGDLAANRLIRVRVDELNREGALKAMVADAAATFEQARPNRDCVFPAAS
jgi:tRNA A37 methylthiotransferase MiaB